MSGTITFTFIPTNAAAPTAATLYSIGGTLTYTPSDLGTPVSVPVYPSLITVYPAAKLEVNYFLQKDVIGDDPSTPEIEPGEPAVLGVLVTNTGGGTADDLSINTAQPNIVDNEKGLAVDFEIVGSQVDGQPVSPSLTVDFGNLSPGQTGDADFQLLSSLQGQFQDFDATFTHSDDLGGLTTSLIDSVQTHELIHAGNFTFPGSTGEQDYLVNDIPDPTDTPDTVYLSNGTTAPVNAATNVTASNSVSDSQLSVSLTANVTSGWTYLQVADPGAGYTLKSVTRSDGTVIPVSDQAWTTDRTIAPSGKAVVDNELHILDLNSTGSYTLQYVKSTLTPTFTGLSASSTIPYGTTSVSFGGKISAGLVFPGDTETVAVSFDGQKVNATLDAQGNFTASFNTATLPASSTPYGVTYSYSGDAVLGKRLRHDEHRRDGDQGNRFAHALCAGGRIDIQWFKHRHEWHYAHANWPGGSGGPYRRGKRRLLFGHIDHRYAARSPSRKRRHIHGRCRICRQQQLCRGPEQFAHLHDQPHPDHRPLWPHRRLRSPPTKPPA